MPKWQRREISNKGLMMMMMMMIIEAYLQNNCIQILDCGNSGAGKGSSKGSEFLFRFSRREGEESDIRGWFYSFFDVGDM